MEISRDLIEFLIVNGCKAAIEAGRKIMTIYNSSDELNVNITSDNLVVTQADRLAHDTIKSVLAPTRIPIMSEEGRNILFEERYSWDLYWLVDPLDGTREFIKKNDEFVVCIALVSENKPLVGVIYQPADDKLFFNDPMNGSFAIENCLELGGDITINSLLENGVKLDYSNSKELAEGEPLKVLVTRSHLNDETADIIDRLKEEYGDVDVVYCGSSKKFGLVLEGKADIYFRTTPLYDWDIAAGYAISLTAGAKITPLGEETIEYNKRELMIPPFSVSYKSIKLN